MREQMLEATKARLAQLQRQYDQQDRPLAVTHEIVRLQAQIAKLERERHEVQP